MKVIGFNGSARKDGNTAIHIRYVFEGLEKEGIETDSINYPVKRSMGAGPVIDVSKIWPG